MTTHASTPTGNLSTDQMRNFFDRLSAGDYHSLARELNITGKRVCDLPSVPADSGYDAEGGGSVDAPFDPDASIQSIDPIDSFKYQATAEGLHRAVSVIRSEESRAGLDAGSESEEEDEAFEFTFRLMIHKLYTIHDFAKMVDDVVFSSRQTFKPLPPALRPRGSSGNKRSFALPRGDDAYEGALGSPRTPSEASSSTLPSSDSSWTLNRFSSLAEDDSDARAVKKRIVGRKLSVVDGPVDDMHADDGGRAWVYDAAVASVESHAPYFQPSLVRACDAQASSEHYYPEEIDGVGCGSRKRRFSFLAARGM